jgi:hypothetical protein
VEAVELNTKYERKHALRRLEKLIWLSRGKNLDVVNLPSLGPSDKGIAIAYLHKNRSSNLHMSQPS